MFDVRTRRVVALCVLLVASVVGGVAGSVHAGHGEEYGNYTVHLPHQSDHYPRGVNGYNASINHFAANTPKSFENSGAPNGIEGLEWLVVRSPEIDFSQCSSSNTAAFGIDRGNNDSGTHTDVSLLDYMEGSTFNKHSIVVDFYEGSDFAAPSDAPVHVNAEDEIVSHQGHKSQGGGCFGMPEEPGWYQMYGKINGTTPSGGRAEIKSVSHYFYICKCDSEQEARNKLGPPPSEGGSDPTPTPTATETATATPEQQDGTADEATATARRASPTDTARPDNDGGGGGGGATRTATSAGGDGSAADGGAQQTARSTAVPTTPTFAEGPGFGAGLALVALLGAALLALPALPRRGDRPRP